MLLIPSSVASRAPSRAPAVVSTYFSVTVRDFTAFRSLKRLRGVREVAEREGEGEGERERESKREPEFSRHREIVA